MLIIYYYHRCLVDDLKERLGAAEARLKKEKKERRKIAAIQKARHSS